MTTMSVFLVAAGAIGLLIIWAARSVRRDRKALRESEEAADKVMPKSEWDVMGVGRVLVRCVQTAGFDMWYVHYSERESEGCWSSEETSVLATKFVKHATPVFKE